MSFVRSSFTFITSSTFHQVRKYTNNRIQISWVCFFVSSGLLTKQILAINHLSGDGIGPNPHPNGFLALTWCCAVFELIVFCVRWLEVRTYGSQRKCCKRVAEVEEGLETGIEMSPGKEASSKGS
jgi:hypothetical protein